MFCDHIWTTDPDELVRDHAGAVLCKACARTCLGCGRVFYKDHLDENDMCAKCGKEKTDEMRR